MQESPYSAAKLKLMIAREIKADAEFEKLYRYLYAPEVLEKRPFLNMGAGAFQHRYWRTSDRLYGDDGKRWLDIEKDGPGTELPPIDHVFDYMSGQPLDIESDSFEAVYTSHSLEHTFDEGALHAISEARRILKPGGVLRIVVPDAEMAFQACRRGDRGFFGFLEKDWPMAYFVASHVSLVMTPDYPGPLTRKDVVQIIDHEPFEQAMDLLYQASRETVAVTGDTRGKHVNWYGYQKLAAIMGQAGFDDIRRSAYGQSLSPVMRDTRYFDTTRPGRSLYVEAVKTGA
jgi:SAM-dependent methyltransferase